MTKLTKILSELTYSVYDTYAYVEFSEDTNITSIAQIIRSLPYVTVVNNRTDKEDLEPRGILEIKVVTTKPGKETFDIVKKTALEKIPELKKFKYSIKRLQKIDEI
jgi:hypothetical protein